MGFSSVEQRKKYQRDWYAKTKRKRDAENKATSKKVFVNARLPVSVLGRLGRIVEEGIATGRFPWRSRNQAIEALLIRGLESLSSDPVAEAMLPYLRMVGSAETIAQHRQEAQAAYSRIKTEVSELLGIGAKDGAIRFVHAMMQEARAMDANEWRDWLITKLETTTPTDKLLREKPRAMPLAGVEDGKQRQTKGKGRAK